MLHGEENDVDTEKVLRDADTNGDGVITLDEFVALCKTQRKLIEPAFYLQNVLIEKSPEDESIGRP